MLNSPERSLDSFDPQFLTFRHNSPQVIPSSGRSIYSQRFDYKSLEKYKVFDLQNSERDDKYGRTDKKIKQIVKEKQLRTIKSQEKYKNFNADKIFNVQQDFSDIQNESVRKKIANSTKQEQKKVYNIFSSQKKSLNLNKDKKLKNQIKHANQQNIQKNIQLKSKLNRLIRNMKKQQKRQIILDQQINEAEGEIQELNKQIEEQQKNMLQLKEISQQNMRQCNKLIDHIQSKISRNSQIASTLQSLQQSVDSQQITIETSRQQETKEKLFRTKIKDQINDLTKARNIVESKLVKLEEQIQFMEEQIQLMRGQEIQIVRMLGFAVDASSIHNNSHSNSNSLSYNQGHSYHSQNSSSGSHHQNTSYY